MKKLVLLIVLLTCLVFLLSISEAPGTLAHSSKPINFRGTIDGFGEENPKPEWHMTIEATVETDSGEIYTLTYTDTEPPATSPSRWRQMFMYAEPANFEFVRVVNGERETHNLTGKGQINVPAWAPVQEEGRENRSEDNNGLLLGRMVGVFNDITEGTWKSQDVVGGHVDFNFTFEKSEYYEKGHCRIDNDPDNWCTTTDGTISGQIIVE